MNWQQRAKKAIANLQLTTYDPETDCGCVQGLELRESVRSGEKMAVLIVSGSPQFALRQGQINQLRDELRNTTEDPLAIFLRIVTRSKQKFEMHLAGPTTYSEILHLPHPMKFCVSPATPFLEKEGEFAKRAALTKGKKMLVVEACGAGIWPIALAPFVKEVVALDRNPYALLDAQENARYHQVKNLLFLPQSLEEFLDSQGIRRYNREFDNMVVL